jgi:hypothetical protein
MVFTDVGVGFSVSTILISLEIFAEDIVVGCPTILLPPAVGTVAILAFVCVAPFLP